MGTSGDSINLSKLGPISTLVDLGSAWVYSFDNFDLFGFDDVVLFVSFVYFFKGDLNLAID